MRKSLVLLLCIIGYSKTVEGQEPTHRHSAQRQFSLLRPFKNPIALPDEVLHTLANDVNVTTSGCGSDPITNSWFEASNIELKDGTLALLVKAKNGCLFGANIGPFWIFTKTADGYSPVLQVSALSLEILSSRTKDHRDIRVGAVSAGRSVFVIYKFDGSKYNET